MTDPQTPRPRAARRSDGTEPDTPAPRPAPRRAGLIPTEVADALAQVLAQATQAIRDNESGSRAGGDIEHVHQMRVATRRIRAYLKAAKPALDSLAADDLRTDLSSLAGTLGQVRDLDVMIDRMHSEAQALGEPDTAALEHLTGILDTDRKAARRALVAVLDQPEFAELLAELDEAAARPPVANPWADLSALAGKEWDKLDRAHGKLVRKFGQNPPDDDLHELRIYGKRARYGAELIAGRSGKRGAPAAVKRFLGALADFQEVLGDHQDASVLEDELRRLVALNPGDTDAALAAGRVIQGCRLRKLEARAAYPAAWDAVKAAATKAFG